MERQRPSPAEVSLQDERLDAALALLEAGVEEVLTSTGFQRYLRAMSTFHDYSPNNILLIMAQRPGAVKVAGYRRWKSLGRHVRAGEHGIRIIAPIVRQQTDPETGDAHEHLVGYRLATVFDLSQTEGAPLPAPPQPRELESSNAVAEIISGRTRSWLTERGITVVRSPIPGHPEAKGTYLPAQKLIRIAPGLASDQEAKTLLHEAGHVVANHRGWEALEDAETVAEASAFVVCAHYGLDTGDYSFPYIAAWARDRAVLGRNLTQIQQTSHTIITALEQQAANGHNDIDTA